MSHDLNAIAVIGISCKFPKSNNIQDFWNNIKNGKECLDTLQEEELERTGVDSSLLLNKNYIRRCSSISDIDKFDADFFKISPKEAVYMDPQQRIILEKAWEAVEDAGYNIDKMNSKVAVFASTSASSYFLESLLRNKNFIEEAGGIKAVMHGLDKDHTATKIAYKMNLTGPAVTVQSACSSSMVGTIMACQSLLTYQCDMALVGGIAVNIPQRVGYLYEKGSVVSQDGYCRPFDEYASGTVFGSGVGCIVLKRLQDAMKDHDRIYSVIKGFAMGNDGNDKIGYTAPGVAGQMNVISEALEFAQVDASTISYVEAHGTATLMGDPIEVEAISGVYEKYTDKKQYCSIGSVKANVGHLNVASGIAGIIKAALMIENKVIPPLVNFSKENSKINFKDTPFYINEQWKEYAGDNPMRVAVSSFGIGGTNGHIIMEAPPEEFRQVVNKSRYLIPVSGRDQEDMVNACRNLLDFLKKYPLLKLADIERTLQCGRKGFKVRKLFKVKELPELINCLEKADGIGNTGKERIIPLKIILPCLEQFDIAVAVNMYQDIPLFKYHADRFIEILSQKGVDGLTGLFYKPNMEEQSNIFGLIVSVAVLNTWEELGMRAEVYIDTDKLPLYEELVPRGINIRNAVEAFLKFPVFEMERQRDREYKTNQKDVYNWFTEAIAEWWESGSELNWEKFVQKEIQKTITLPTYPFKRNPYWSYDIHHKSMQPDFQMNNMPRPQFQHDRPKLSTPFFKSETQLQERLIGIWTHHLGIRKIGVKDNFFELGGHSLMAAQLLAAIKSEFLVELELDELFSSPTIVQLADIITQKLSEYIEGMDEQEINAFLEMETEYEGAE